MIYLSKIYNDKQLSLFALLGFNLALTIFRICASQSLFLIFLVWNLVLSGVPFAISAYLLHKPSTNIARLLSCSFVWLLFLPNAPYIITDFLHLHMGQDMPAWYDILLLTSYSFSGILFGLLSMADMEKVWKLHFGQKTAHAFIFGSAILSGFGMYLGRYERYNSWDIIHTPIALFSDIFLLVFELRAIGFTLGYGMLLYLVYSFLKNNSKIS